jgi:hypothetical protein
LHFAYLLVLSVSDHLCPLALWTAFPSSLAGRDSCDYYGHCVAIGLAPLRVHELISGPLWVGWIV